MFFKLFLLFALIPVIELAILIKVGSFLGTSTTVLIVILTAVIGAYLVKLEGLGVMYRIQKNMSEGIFPGEELFNGMIILVAGALLLTPGFFTDIAGFAMVFPPTREYVKKIARYYIRKKMDSDNFHIHIS